MPNCKGSGGRGFAVLQKTNSNNNNDINNNKRGELVERKITLNDRRGDIGVGVEIVKLYVKRTNSCSKLQDNTFVRCHFCEVPFMLGAIFVRWYF